ARKGRRGHIPERARETDTTRANRTPPARAEDMSGRTAFPDRLHRSPVQPLPNCSDKRTEPPPLPLSPSRTFARIKCSAQTGSSSPIPRDAAERMPPSLPSGEISMPEGSWSPVCVGGMASLPPRSTPAADPPTVREQERIGGYSRNEAGLTP